MPPLTPMRSFASMIAMLIPTLLLLTSSRTVMSMQVFLNTSFIGSDLTVNCSGALLAEVGCGSDLLQVSSGPAFSPAVLDQVCTTLCSEALIAYEAEVKRECSGQAYRQPDGTELPVSFLPASLLYRFNRACLLDKGRYCNNVAYQLSIFLDPEAPRMLGNESEHNGDAIDACDDCFIKLLQLDATFPLSENSALAPIFSSLTSSCSKSGFELPTPSLTFTASASTTAATAVSTCTGSVYTIKPGDDCHSISRSQGVGTAWLLTDNNLHAHCANFPGSNRTLCIQNFCKVYTVSANDTCSSIARSNGISIPQLRSWNPVLSMSCGNIGSMVGDEICISNPGSPYASSAMPVMSFANITTYVPAPTNAANGTNKRCAQYYEAQVGDYCNLLVMRFSISLEDFVFLNPSINSNCTNLYAFESYCVKPVGNIIDYPGQPGYIAPTATITDIPYESFSVATYTPPAINAAGALPFANLTRPNCSIYADGSMLNVDITGTSYRSVCDLWADIWNVEALDLMKWNPSLPQNSTNCRFDSGFKYCMFAGDSSQTTQVPDQTNSQFPLASSLPTQNGSLPSSLHMVHFD